MSRPESAGGKRNRISPLEKISFGLGDFAINGAFTFVSSYLLYFYTDSIRLGLGAAGMILLLGRMVDAIASLAAGEIVDRTGTKYGRCRPFLAVMAAPMILLMCILFFMPELPDSGKVWIGCIGYILFSICYAFVNVPFSTMLSVITDRNQERVSLNVFKNIGGNAGALFVTMLALVLVKKFGGAENSPDGYFKTALFYGIFFLAGLVMCALFTRERVQAKKKDPGLKESAKAALGNRNWIIFIVIQFIGMFYMILHNQGTFYYTKYCLKDENLNMILLSLTPFMCILCAFALPAVSRRIGMTKILMSGHGLVFLSLLGTLAAGKNRAAVVACAVLTSLGWSVATGMIFVMLSQLIDMSEKQSGVRPQGFMTSWMTFFMKAGVALAGWAGPLILKAGGYMAGQAADAGSIQAIKMNFIYLPAVLSFLLMILSLAYQKNND